MSDHFFLLSMDEADEELIAPNGEIKYRWEFSRATCLIFAIKTKKQDKEFDDVQIIVQDQDSGKVSCFALDMLTNCIYYNKDFLYLFTPNECFCLKNYADRLSENACLGYLLRKFGLNQRAIQPSDELKFDHIMSDDNASNRTHRQWMNYLKRVDDIDAIHISDERQLVMLPSMPLTDDPDFDPYGEDWRSRMQSFSKFYNYLFKSLEQRLSLNVRSNIIFDKNEQASKKNSAIIQHFYHKLPRLPEFLSYSHPFDFSEVNAQIGSSSTSGNRAAGSLAKGKSKINSDSRFAVCVQNYDQFCQALNQLADECPNFSEVTDYLKKYTKLRMMGDGVFGFEPILLLGAPGTGKSYFAKKLASLFGLTLHQVNLENSQLGADLVGTSSHFSNSSMGIVAQSLICDWIVNPIIYVDEIDKVGVSHTTHGEDSVIKPFYQLLEPDQMKHFRDESLPEVVLDGSRISWILTANYQDQIPEPILNRMRVFEVQMADEKQFTQVVQNMILNEMRQLGILKTTLFDLSQDEIADLYAYTVDEQKSLRDVKRLLKEYMSEKAVNPNFRLVITRKNTMPTFGFI